MTCSTSVLFIRNKTEEGQLWNQTCFTSFLHAYYENDSYNLNQQGDLKCPIISLIEKQEGLILRSLCRALP